MFLFWFKISCLYLKECNTYYKLRFFFQTFTSTYVSWSTRSFASFLLSLKMCLKQCMNCIYVVGPTNTSPIMLDPPLSWCFKLIFSSRIDSERGSLALGSSGGDSALVKRWSSPAQGIWWHSLNTWPWMVDRDTTTLSLQKYTRTSTQCFKDI